MWQGSALNHFVQRLLRALEQCSQLFYRESLLHRRDLVGQLHVGLLLERRQCRDFSVKFFFSAAFDEGDLDYLPNQLPLGRENEAACDVSPSSQKQKNWDLIN